MMLSRRELGGGMAAAAAVRRHAPERPATPPEPAKEPNVARILRTRRLRVGGPVSEEPYLYKNSGSGQWNGILLAMASDLAAALGVELAFVETNWADMVTDLNTGKIDLAYG